MNHKISINDKPKSQGRGKGLPLYKNIYVMSRSEIIYIFVVGHSLPVASLFADSELREAIADP